MIAFILRRLLQAVPVLFLSSVAIFLLLYLLPGDPALILAGPDANPATLPELRRSMGLDRPLPVQYGLWLGRVVRGDLGQAFISRRPVAQLIAQRLPATIELALASIALALLLAIPTGVLAAVKQRGPVDWVISSLTALLLAIPNFWFGILTVLLFAVALRWLPPGGRIEFARDPGLALRSLLLPAVTLALGPAAVLSRFVKTSLLEALAEDYVRTARAKGLREGAIIRRHALRNALVPVVTILGLMIGGLLGGAVIVEAVFIWPGVGQLVLQAILNRDYPVVQAVLLLTVTSFVVVNLLTDLIYAVLDPRIRFSTGRSR